MIQQLNSSGIVSSRQFRNQSGLGGKCAIIQEKTIGNSSGAHRERIFESVHKESYAGINMIGYSNRIIHEAKSSKFYEVNDSEDFTLNTHF